MIRGCSHLIKYKIIGLAIICLAVTVLWPGWRADLRASTDYGYNDDGTTPSDDGTTPPNDGTTPPNDGSTPPNDGSCGYNVNIEVNCVAPDTLPEGLPEGTYTSIKLMTNATAPGLRASRNCTEPPDDGTTPPDDGTTPPDDGTTPPDDGTTPPDDGTTTCDTPLLMNSVDTGGFTVTINDVNGDPVVLTPIMWTLEADGMTLYIDMANVDRSTLPATAAITVDGYTLLGNTISGSTTVTAEEYDASCGAQPGDEQPQPGDEQPQPGDEQPQPGDEQPQPGGE